MRVPPTRVSGGTGVVETWRLTLVHVRLQIDCRSLNCPLKVALHVSPARLRSYAPLPMFT